MSDEEELESQSLDTLPLSKGFSICDYDDTDDTEPALSVDVKQKSREAQMKMNGGADQSDIADESSDLDKIQDLVAEMKLGFSQALNELAKIQYSDRALEDKLNEHKADYRKQLSEIVQMILSLKTEFGTPLGQIRVALEEHKVLKRQVEALQQENDLLMEELERKGTISEGMRKRCSSYGSPISHSTSLPESSLMTPPRGRTPSDRDSGVTTNQNDSSSTCGERSPPEVAQITPMVHNYIDNLHPSGADRLEDSDESDNSVTAVANKSIDLSRSLVDKCRVESDEEESATTHPSQQQQQQQQHQQQQQQQQHRAHYHHHLNNYDRENLDRRKSMPSPTSLLASPFSRKTAPHELAFRDKQRSRVAHELVETERKYCSCLWTMVDFLLESLKTAAVINNRDVKLMFPVALSSMYDFHADILKRFDERIGNWKLHAIVGDIFARMTDPNSDFLLLYQTYVNDFQTSLQTIRKCSKQSHKFRKLLMTLQIHPVCDGLDLTAYLLTPIQRIPRYVLLIKQMLAFTEPDHPDHYYLESTLEKLKTFLDQLNNSIESGFPMHQYSYIPDNRSHDGSSRRYSSPYEAAESETGSDVTSQSLEGDTSIISMSARNLTNSRARLQQVRVVEEPLPQPLPRTKLFQHSNQTLPSRRRRQRSQTADRPKSLYDRLDSESLEYDAHVDVIQGGSFQQYGETKRSKSQSNILDASPRQRDSLSRSLVESDLIDKLIASKANARSLPSVAQVDEEPCQPILNIWRDETNIDPRHAKVNNNNMVAQSEGASKKKGGFIRHSIKSIFSRKRNSKNYDASLPRHSVPNLDSPPFTVAPPDDPQPRYQIPLGDEVLMTSLLEDDGTPCSAV